MGVAVPAQPFRRTALATELARRGGGTENGARRAFGCQTFIVKKSVQPPFGTFRLEARRSMARFSSSVRGS